MEVRNVDLDTIWKVRKEVMYPAEELNYVQLADDGSGTHLGLFMDDRLVSIVSLFERGDSVQFRKFATLHAEQGKGYGSALLDHIMQQAFTNGKRSVWCNARVSVSGFYQRFGMYTTGLTWWKKDLEFVKMEKQFN